MVKGLLAFLHDPRHLNGPVPGRERMEGQGLVDGPSQPVRVVDFEHKPVAAVASDVHVTDSVVQPARIVHHRQ